MNFVEKTVINMFTCISDRFLVILNIYSTLVTSFHGTGNEGPLFVFDQNHHSAVSFVKRWWFFRNKRVEAQIISYISIKS